MTSTFVICGIWCLADVLSVSPSSEQTRQIYLTIIFLKALMQKRKGTAAVAIIKSINYRVNNLVKCERALHVDSYT